MEKLHETGVLLRINLEVEVNLGPVIELADGLGFAFPPFVLGVNLIVDRGGKRGKAVGAVDTDDIGFYRAGAGVGEVDDGIGQGIILRIKYFAEEQAAN